MSESASKTFDKNESESSVSPSEKDEKPSCFPFSSKSFFPVQINLHGRKVLVAGSFDERGDDSSDLESAYLLLSQLLSTGAHVDVATTSKTPRRLEDLRLAYGERLSVLESSLIRISEGKVDLTGYFLVYSFCPHAKDNMRIEELADLGGAFFTRGGPGADNDFSQPSWLRRGRIKLSVSTDGLSSSLERALLNRISAALVSDFDRYKLFADYVFDRLRALKDGTTNGDIDERTFEEVLNRVGQLDEEVYSALSRQNFEEAYQHFEKALESLIAGVNQQQRERE